MRVASVGMGVGLAITLVLRPEIGLFLFWRVFIPVLPLLFFFAPALWRNICPMAALNQAPRLSLYAWAAHAALAAELQLCNCGEPVPAAGGDPQGALQLQRGGPGGLDPVRTRRSAADGGSVPRQERLVQQHLPASAHPARLWADALCDRATPALPALPRLHTQLLRPEPTQRTACGPARRYAPFRRPAQGLRRHLPGLRIRFLPHA